MNKAKQSVAKDKSKGLVPFGGNFVEFIRHLSTDPYQKINALKIELMKVIDLNAEGCFNNLNKKSGGLDIKIDGLMTRLSN